MPSLSTTRLPPLKTPYKVKRPSNRGRDNRMADTKPTKPYSLMHLLSELPSIHQRKSAKNNNNNKFSDAEARTIKTPNERTWNVYQEKLPRPPRTPRTPGIREENKIESTKLKDKKNSANTKEKIDRVNINNNNKVQHSKSQKKVREVTKPVPKTPVDTYLRPKTQAEKSISKYVRLPPIQRAYTFTALRKHKQAASDFLAVLKANYPRYTSKQGKSRSTSVLSLARSRSVISVGEHISRHTNSRISRSRSVFELNRSQSRHNRSRSVDPVKNTPRSRSRSRSRGRRTDKSTNKRSRSLSVSRRSSSRPPLLPRPTRTSLARSKSLITLASTNRPLISSRTGRRKSSHRGRTPSLPEIRRSVSHASLVSTNNNGNSDEGMKKKKPSPLFVAIKPENLTMEKTKFLKFPNYIYSPQFVYANPISETQLAKYSRASDKFLDIAIKIMNNALQKFGTYERYMEQTGGRKLGRFEIVQAAKQYLRKENMENEVDIVLSEDLLSRARMSVMGGRPTVIIRAVNMRESWVDGMLRHEIGTHYIRAWNNKLQTWGKARMRKEMGLDPANPTEEGLASLNSVLFRRQPCLWRCALLYYTIYKATQLSFSDLFIDLGKFVKDQDVRWEYCIRAKRGYSDTSLPGAFCKDQVYLTGALQILKHRNDIDFHLLVKCGKVSWRDLNKLELKQPELVRTRIPGFLVDVDAYRNELTRVIGENGLTQEDLQYV